MSRRLFRTFSFSLLTFSLAFLVSFVGSGLFMPSYVPSDAASNLELTSTPSLSLAAGDLALGTMNPTASGAQTTASATVTTTTNNPTGYTLTMTSSETETCMRRSSGLSTPCGSLTAANKITAVASSGSTIAANAWGVSTNSGTTWQPIPAAGASGISLANTSAPSATSGDNVSIMAGVNVNMGITSGAYQSAITYTLLPKTVPAPTITSISPATGSTGTAITITGTNFMGVYEVKIGGVDCDSVSIVNTTTITCNAPDGPVGPTAVSATVKTYGGTATGGSFTYPTPASVCRNADSTSACQVDIDAKMIPVKYTGSTSGGQWTVANTATKGDWYDYSIQQWANAVAVKTSGCVSTCPTAATTPGTVLSEADILGYYVYIPRFAYQVRRSSPKNYAVCGDGTYSNATCSNGTASAFDIKFQKASDAKLYPYGVNITSGTPGSGTCEVYSIGSYAACVAANSPGANMYWTHQAFSFGDNCDVKPDGTVGNNSSCTELNGIWVGKFETTNTAANPMVRPYLGTPTGITAANGTSLVSQTVATQWTTVHTTLPTYQNLTTSTTDARMMKNSDWGAVAYLATSSYGRASASSGIEVWINPSSSIYTGCAGASVSAGSATGCANMYYTTNGMHASTTDNTYGIYDLSGGAYEYTLSNYSNGATGLPSSSGLTAGTGGTFFTNAANKYFNIYLSTQFTNNGTYTNYQQCTFTSCAGQALYETLAVLSASSSSQSWNSEYSHFVYSANPWAIRGGDYSNATVAGLFYSSRNTGGSYTGVGFRTVLNNVPSIAQNGSIMQSIAAVDQCPTTRTWVVDARDNHTYWIQQLDAGAGNTWSNGSRYMCWMETNLAYAGGGANTYNDTKTMTSISGSTASTYNTAQVITTAGGAAVTTAPTAPSTTTGSGGQYGYLYNWCAAMGGQSGACTADTTTPSGYSTDPVGTSGSYAQSVCPTNWKLPTGGTGDTTRLNTVVNSGSTYGDSGLLSNWLGVYAKQYYSGLNVQGTNGNYWSSTVSGTTGAYALSYDASGVSPAIASNRFLGFAVRCVL